MTRARLALIICGTIGLWDAAGGAALAQDVSGIWNVNVELDIGPGHITLELSQEGTELTGIYRGMFDESEVTGSIADDRVTLSFQTQGVTVTYNGTVAGESMQGQCRYGDLGTGTWEGVRVE